MEQFIWAWSKYPFPRANERFAQDANAGIWIVNVTSGTSRLVAEFEHPKEAEHIWEFLTSSFHPMWLMAPAPIPKPDLSEDSRRVTPNAPEAPSPMADAFALQMLQSPNLLKKQNLQSVDELVKYLGTLNIQARPVLTEPPSPEIKAGPASRPQGAGPPSNRTL